MGKLSEQIKWALVLLAFDLIYLALVAVTFIAGIDLAANKTMQYFLHITVILSALAYLFFVEIVYRTEGDIISGRLALIFSALFTVPVLIGRGIGLAAISGNMPELSGLFNFYANVSVSRIIELISWTVLFPMSMLCLARTFYKSKGKTSKTLSILCLVSAICCFVAFMTIVSTNLIYLWIGLMGWGVLFLLIIVVYIFRVRGKIF